MKIGFLGTGHITSSVIEGIFKSKLKIKKIYISPEEDEKWRDRDCLKIFEEKVTSNKSMTLEKIKQLKDSIDKEMLEAVEFAEKSPMPDIGELYSDVYVKYKD